MTYAPGAPASVWAIPGDVVGGQAKVTLMWLWSKADHNVQQSPQQTTVWVAAREGMSPAESVRADIALGTGCTERQVRSHLTLLRRLGLLDVCGRLITLFAPHEPSHARNPATVSRQHVTEARQSCQESGDSISAARDGSTAALARNPAINDGKPSLQLNPPVPPNTPQQPPTTTAPICCDTESQQFSLAIVDAHAPKLGPVDRVLAYWNERVAVTREWACLTRAQPLTCTTDTRRLIDARIKSAGGGDPGIEACRKVIQVQENQARWHGICPTPDRRSEWKELNGWKYWKPSVLFSVKNFDKWLERWSEDGDHEIWDSSRRNKPERHGDSYGRNAAQAADHEVAKRTGFWPSGNPYREYEPGYCFPDGLEDERA